jgi:hypothetical protein
LEKSRRLPLGGLALIGEGCFLLVTFLCSPSKKSNSPKAKAFKDKAEAKGTGSPAFAGMTSEETAGTGNYSPQKQ